MKSNTKRRLNRAATLALLLTLLPNGLTAAAADTYSLHVGGVEITSENLTVNGDSGTATYDPASHTLTLDNYSYTGAGYGDSEGGGIDYRGGTDLTIVLNGSNSIVKSSVSTPDRSHGIYFHCSGKTLTISGEGSLDISFQSASSGIWKRNGIFCEPGAFVMESGTVTSAGGTADESAGIYTDDGITINGGTFTGIGNPTTDYESRGIYSGSITVNGGKAIGRATNTDKTAYAFQGDVTVNGGELTASASTDSGEAKAFSWDSCEVAGELLEMRVGDSEATATVTTNVGDVSGKKYVYIKAAESGSSASGSDPVSASYLDAAWNETTETVDFTEKTAADCTSVTSGDTAWTDGWYVADSDVTISSRIAVTGEAHLILCDGKTLTASAGITVSDGNSLTIYAQSDGDSMGKLSATGGDFQAGIGGDKNQPGGAITVNGGAVTATGGKTGNTTGAGIGGGGGTDNAGENGGAGGVITVNGGAVTAKGGKYSAGIGGGGAFYGGSAGGEITVNGGKVTAKGGGNAAGIGGGLGGDGGKIAINGGSVTATGSAIGGAGIGGGLGGDGGKIAINGGAVTATGGKTGNTTGAGIGGGYKATESGTISLSWTDKDNDSITASSYTGTVTFEKEFVIDGETDVLTAETLSTANGKKIVPYELSAATWDTEPAAQSLTYNGEEQALVTAGTATGGTVQYKAGDSGEYAATIPTAKDAGTYTVYYKIVGDDSHTDTEEASVSVTIAPKEAALEWADTALTYNGAAQKPTAMVSNLESGDSCGVTVTGEQTNVGTYTATATALDNANYTLPAAAMESFTIGQAALTVTADGKAKTYGDEDPELTYTTEGLVSGDTLSGALSRETGENAGEYAITQGTLSAGDNYEVSFVGADLTISKRAVTLTSATDSKVYDGAALTNDEVTVSGDGFIDGEGASYNVTGTQTLPGCSANTFTYTLNSGTNADNYEITTVNGTLTVTDRNAPNTEEPDDPDKKYEITVTANSDTVLYDGTEHSVSGFETLEYTFDNVTYTVSGLSAEVTGTDARTYPVTVTGTAVVKDPSGNDLTAQFIVNTVDGSLTIDKRSVTLTSATKSREYNGSALTDDTVTVGGDGFADGEGAAYSVTGTRTLVGASENTFTYTLNDGTLADNYTITTANGNLTVTNRNAQYTVTLTANSGEFLYDGAEKTVTGWTIDGAAGGVFTASNGLQYTVSGMTAEILVTDAGTYTVNVTGTAEVKDSGGNDVTDQFAVSTESGTLIINKRAVTLTSGTDSKVYDGAALTNSEVTVSGDGFASGEGAAYSVTGTRTLPGSSANAFTYTLNEGTKAENYEITTVNGTLTVTDRTSAGDTDYTETSRKYEITLTANSGEFQYDGRSHSVSGFETLEFTFGSVTYTVSGVEASATATNVGETDVVITGTPVVKVKDSGETDLAAQFIVNKVSGKLTITKATPEYTVPTGLSATYGDTLSVVSLPSGWAWDNPAASVGDAGISSFSVTFTPSDTRNYNTVTETVSVTVNKAAPDAGQLPSAVSSLVYDGAAHTLVTSGSSGGGVYRYRLGPDGAWSEALPSAVEAGNYTVYYYLAGDKNHLDLGSASAPLGSVSTVIASPEMPVISGKVLRAEDGTEIGDATVRLMRGSEEAASTVTAPDGSYQITAEPGLYNIVVEWTNSVETLTKTEMIMVSGGTTKDVYVSSGRVNSVLEVMPETPSVIVGGLDAEAQTVKEVDGGSIVTVRMVVERSADDGDTSAIQSAAAGQDVDSFEIRVEKTVDSVTTPLKQTMTVLELVIPFSFGGKENVTIYRIHDDSVTAMTESASGEDATFWLDKTGGFIHVYANQFSTYAVAYTQCYNITGAIAYGDYTGTITVSLVEVNSKTPAASREITLSGGMGAYSFTHIPKGTYTLTAKWLDGEMETALNKEIEVH